MDVEEMEAPANEQSPQEIAGAVLKEQAEAPPAAPDQSKLERDRLASTYAELAKKQRALRQKEQTLAELSTKKAKYDELDSLRTKDPVKFLEKHGLTIDDVINAATKEGAAPKDKAQIEFENLKAELEAQKTELAQIREERQRLEQEKNYRSLVDNIKSELSNDDGFEALNTWGNYEAVAAVMQRHYAETGDVLSPKDAATMVQNYIIQQSETFFKSKMIRSKYERYFSPGDKVDTQRAHAVTSAKKTLSNAISGTQGPAHGGESHGQRKPLTREQRLARAAKLIRWE